MTGCLAGVLAALSPEERQALIEAQAFEPAFDRPDKVTQNDKTTQERALKASEG